VTQIILRVILLNTADSWHSWLR